MERKRAWVFGTRAVDGIQRDPMPIKGEEGSESQSRRSENILAIIEL